jgi:methionyl-tRNA synthetase
MKKQFTKKQIEKLFKEIYTDGEIYLGKGEWWYCESKESRCINLRCSNLYDVAEKLNLVPQEEIKEMKRLAGYYV